MSIALALVVPTMKPWIASVAVPRNVTGHAGRHDDALRHERILLRDQAHRHLAVGIDRGAEVALDELARQVQRLRVDDLDSRRRHRRPVQAGEHHHRDQRDDDDAHEDGPAPLGRDGDRFGRHCTAPRGR
jgi:hypothetical protein